MDEKGLSMDDYLLNNCDFEQVQYVQIPEGIYLVLVSHTMGVV